VALTEVKKAFHCASDDLINHVYLAIIYALIDRQEEDGDAAKKVLEINPKYFVESAKALPYNNQAEIKLFIDGLHKAGLK
jgi:hypothetical protein